MKKNKNLQRLMGYAGRFRYLTYSSWVLSALSALLALAPFWYLWKIMQEVLQTAPHFEQATHLIANGWMAVLFAVAAFAVYVAALMCSHLSAFQVATEIRKQTMAHILRLPLGLTETYLGPISCRIKREQLPRHTDCWCCCLPLIGGWACSV